MVDLQYLAPILSILWSIWIENTPTNYPKFIKLLENLSHTQQPPSIYIT